MLNLPQFLREILYLPLKRSDAVLAFTTQTLILCPEQQIFLAQLMSIAVWQVGIWQPFQRKLLGCLLPVYGMVRLEQG